MTSIGKGRWTPRWPIEGREESFSSKKILSRRVSLRLPLRSLAVQLAGTALTFGSAYGVVLWAGYASNIAQLALAIPAGAAVYAASLLIGDRNWFRLLKKR